MQERNSADVLEKGDVEAIWGKTAPWAAYYEAICRQIEREDLNVERRMGRGIRISLALLAIVGAAVFTSIKQDSTNPIFAVVLVALLGALQSSYWWAGIRHAENSLDATKEEYRRIPNNIRDTLPHPYWDQPLRPRTGGSSRLAGGRELRYSGDAIFAAAVGLLWCAGAISSVSILVIELG